MAIRMGEKVRDSITGYEGTATSRTEYLYGCVRVCVEATGLSADGKPIEAQWFDEQRLDVASKATSGGPTLTPPHRDPPRR